MTEQDFRVAKQILPRLVTASMLLDAEDIPDEIRAKCVGAIADAYRLLATLFEDNGIEFEILSSDAPVLAPRQQ